MDFRYIKLSLTWDQSPWLEVLSDGAQLAWLNLLCYAKETGRAGVAKSMTVKRASCRWGRTEEAVAEMLGAAITNGALSKDEGGLWIITKWQQYQGDDTNAVRQQKYREKIRNENNALREDDETGLKTDEKHAEKPRRKNNNASTRNSNAEEKRREEKKREITSSKLQTAGAGKDLAADPADDDPQADPGPGGQDSDSDSLTSSSFSGTLDSLSDAKLRVLSNGGNALAKLELERRRIAKLAEPPSARRGNVGAFTKGVI